MMKEKNSCEHYFWGDQCEGWRFVDESGLSVIEERMPPHTAEKLHFHKKSQQLFYVTSGTAVFDIDGREYQLDSHKAFYVKPGSLHRIKNDSFESLNFIVISQPSTRGDRFEK